MKYKDFYLVPKYSDVASRKECDTTVNFFGFEFLLPIVPSNMPAVIDINLAWQLAEKGYFYILHRFMPYDLIAQFVSEINNAGLVSSIGVGVKQHDYDLIDELVATDVLPDFITVDVAHGHSLLVYKMVTYIKSVLPDTVLIAGNVGSVEAVRDLQAWGVDCVKGGIGNGSACTTYPSTGFYCHPATLLADLQNEAWVNVKLIADGGVHDYGDVAKALALGADMVMIGGMLAGHRESPGKIVTDANGLAHKHYYGNASARNGNTHNIEGTTVEVPLRGSIFDTLDELKGHLQSSISYCGGRNLSVFNDAKWRLH